MCIAFFGLDAFPQHPQLRFLLAFGRDEYLTRPTEPVHFWKDAPHILAGRDLVAQGTWLGVTTTGRLAFLTNLRAKDPLPGQGQPHMHSRGELISNFLNGIQSPQEYLQGVPCQDYNGFNLVVLDLMSGTLSYLNNIPPEAAAAAAGVGDAAAAGGTTAESTTGGGTAPGSTAAGDAVQGSAGARYPAGPSSPLQEGGGAEQAAGAGAPEAAAAGTVPGGAARGSSGDAGAVPLPPGAWSPVALQPGVVYGLSNGVLNEWSKVQAGVSSLKLEMEVAVQEERDSMSAGGGTGLHVPWDSIFHNVLGDDVKDEALRVAGAPLDVDEQLEYVCSSRFIEPVGSREHGPYGTRSQVVLAVWRDGSAELRERHLHTGTMR